MIFLSLSSKQVWPHILAVSRFKPDRIVFFHSDSVLESKGPARRLKRFFDKRFHGENPPESECIEIPHDDFTAIENHLDQTVANLQLDLNQCVLNFTGGNKLMAAAAFQWATRRGIPSFYLERGNFVTWFEPRDGEVDTRTEALDGHITDSIDPVALLQCQIDASEVERIGERLTLNELGQETEVEEMDRLQRNGTSLDRYLDFEGAADKDWKKGDALEINVAAVLLKLGVPSVQRSLRLKVKTGTGISSRNPHAEIDLLFNWSGRLWIVDCKDRKAAENLASALGKAIGSNSNKPGVSRLLGRIGDELSIGQTKVLKEDLIVAREMGGLLGKVVCVRKADLPEEVQEFARSNQVKIVKKDELVEGWRRLLDPGAKPTQDDLKSLENLFSDSRGIDDGN